ncbi:MAG TPA: ABC transporter permease [Blastocatellia bacterium]|nr:ABC transporter permease [Blastocatellia bacterium]
MTVLSRLRSVLRNLFRKERVEADLNQEIEAYRQLVAEQGMRKGMSPQDANRAARLELGGTEQVKEQVRAIRSGHHLEVLWQDLKYGARTLRKSPGFTVVAVITLALGVGANAAIFSVVNAVLLRSLPFERAGDLAIIRTNYLGGNTLVTSWKDSDDWRARSHFFERIALFDQGNQVMSGRGDASVIRSGYAGPGFFHMFDIHPVLGALFSPEHYKPESAHVAALAESFWRQHFGGDPGIVGSALVIDGYETTILGIVPDRFDAFMGSHIQIWLPLQRMEEARDQRHLKAAGLLRPSLKAAQASKEIETIAADLQKQYPDSNDGWSATALPVQDSIAGNIRPMLLILLGVVGMVLLVACANIANLLLARGAARRKELAIRAALGAGRMRLVRQLLTEGLIISVLGGSVALLLAAVAIKTLTGMAPTNIPRLSEIGLDGTVIAFTAVLAFGANLTFGLLPALRISGAGSGSALKEAGRGVRGDRRHTQLRRSLLVSELAISLVLLIGCGLLIRSLHDVAEVRPGFNPKDMVEAQISLPYLKYKTEDSRLDFYNRLLAKLDSGEIESAALCRTLPLGASEEDSWYFASIEGVARTPKTTVASQNRPVSPGYFHTMGIPLLAGRDFNQFDKKGSPEVTILSRAFARQLYGSEKDAVGKRVFYDTDKSVEIVGVVGDVKPWGLEGEGDPGSYAPFAQGPEPSMVVVAREKAQANTDTQAAGGLLQSIRDAVRSIDKDAPVSAARTMDELVDASMAQRKFYLALISILGGLSFVLATIGAYGVISYSVAERTQEIGIRMALGATRGEILSLVVGQGFRLAIAGSAIGIAGAVALTRVLRTFLYSVGPRDPITFAVTCAFLILVALVASYVPARRAAKVDPMGALRAE